MADIAVKHTLAVVAIGGALGALARYGLVSVVQAKPDGFPVATLLVNFIGCALIGVLMVTLTELKDVHGLVRPFLGVGVLGGFTTFSAYAEDIRSLLGHGAIVVALAYLFATVISALVAVAAGMRVARWVL